MLYLSNDPLTCYICNSTNKKHVQHFVLRYCKGYNAGVLRLHVQYAAQMQIYISSTIYRHNLEFESPH